ncbi:MAG: cyclic nucleotide-binding domain-containing protein [Pirellulales bacterium]
MSHNITVGQLSKFCLFRGCDEGELTAALEACVLQIAQPGDQVLVTGQMERALWLLVIGTANVSLEVPGHDSRQVATIGPGAVVGEMSFCRDAVHSATVTAESACTFARLDRARFETLAASHPALAAKVMMNVAELLAARLQATDHWIAEWLSSAEDSKLRDRAEQLRQSFVLRSEATNAFLGLNWQS